MGSRRLINSIASIVVNGLRRRRKTAQDEFYPIGARSGNLQNKDFLTRRKIRFLGSRHRVWHSYVEFVFIDQLLTQNKFDIVVELGTGNGGITTLLAIHCLRLGAPLHTFDHRGEPNRGLYRLLRKRVPIKFHGGDLFSEENTQLVRTILQRGRTFLYCDNGDKNLELMLFAPFLKENDVVLLHDKDQEVFYKDIHHIVTAERLKPFFQELADSIGAGIFSFIKAG